MWDIAEQMAFLPHAAISSRARLSVQSIPRFYDQPVKLTLVINHISIALAITVLRSQIFLLFYSHNGHFGNIFL